MYIYKRLEKIENDKWNGELRERERIQDAKIDLIYAMKCINFGKIYVRMSENKEPNRSDNQVR